MNTEPLVAKDAKYKSILEQRIKEIASTIPIDISQLAIKAEVNESTLYGIFSKGSARPKTLDKIARALNVDAKELLSNNKPKSSQDDIPNEDLKVGRQALAKKTQLFLSQLPEKDAELYIPYYDVEITAGKIELYFDDVEETPEGYVYAPQYQGCVMCNVKGNSMYDLIHPGARLYIYPMPDKKYIDFGQIYLVILNNNFRILKYVRRHPTDDKLVVLASHNKEHDSWDVEKADIINLFLVKGYENQTAM